MDRQSFEILNFFINNDALTLRELQSHFSVSRVTITKNIRAINNYSAMAKLQTNFLKKDLDFNDPSKRQATILKELLQQITDYVILDDLAESLAVSRGTINKDLKALKQQLDYYQVRIETKTNRGIHLAVEHDYMYAVITRTLVGKYYELEATWDKATDVKLLNLVKKLDHNNDTVTMVKRNIAVINVKGSLKM